MRITGLAIFWTRKGAERLSTQFHADMHRYPSERSSDVARRFEAMFPNDVIRSMRDHSGKFISFKESK
jgi:Rod binding domain-containing protein